MGAEHSLLNLLYVKDYGNVIFKGFIYRTAFSVRLFQKDCFKGYVLASSVLYDPVQSPLSYFK